MHRKFIWMPTLDSAEAAISSKTHDNQLLPDVSSEKDHLAIAMSNQGKSIHILSSLRARARLCYAPNLIQCMERNSIEHPELANIFSSVNMILPEHGYDHGIIRQALDVYPFSTYTVTRRIHVLSKMRSMRRSTAAAAGSTIVGTVESTGAKNHTDGTNATSIRGTSHEVQEATQSKEGSSTVNTTREQDSDARMQSKTPSLTVPPCPTPSITIPDPSSSLDPTRMPFLSLPLSLENGESLPRSESPEDMIRSAKEENGQPDRVSSAIPPSTSGSAKERRSKSVLFHPSPVLEQLKKVGNGTDGRESDGCITHRKNNGQGLSVTISSSQLQLSIARPPVLSFTESILSAPVLSPPLPWEPNLHVSALTGVEFGGDRSDQVLEEGRKRFK
ncbi:hypothetical protein BGX34_004743 [Mortierella sp. NVP85]|nr:hypothetical protein BGX34_004743 [Mortierella sp. NVP85]